MDNHVTAVDVSSNMASIHKLDRLDISLMSILGEIDTKFGYRALLDATLLMKTRSAAAILDFTLQ